MEDCKEELHTLLQEDVKVNLSSTRRFVSRPSLTEARRSVLTRVCEQTGYQRINDQR